MIQQYTFVEMKCLFCELASKAAIFSDEEMSAKGFVCFWIAYFGSHDHDRQVPVAETLEVGVRPTTAPASDTHAPRTDAPHQDMHCTYGMPCNSNIRVFFMQKQHVNNT